MTRTRITARSLLLVAAFTGLAATSAAASPDRVPPPGRNKPAPRPPARPTPPAQNVRKIIFPVVGRATYTDDYGDPRGQGAHQGIDIMAPRRALAVAAEAGKVRLYTTSARAGCMLYLYGASGTTYLYIHLNNDTTGRNDNKGKCVAGTAYAPGLRTGAHVNAGDIVGYVGDSGDADGGNPHLHFEVHPKNGASTNPYPFLRVARKLLYTARARVLVTISMSGTLVATDDGSVVLKVDALRTSGGLRLNKVGRSVVLATTPALAVEAMGGRQLPIARLTGALRQPVVVFTDPAGWTLRERLGSARALWASRVVLVRA